MEFLPTGLRFCRCAWLAALLGAASAIAAAPAATRPDLDGADRPLFTGDARDIVVLFFIAPECPVSNRSVPAMRALAAEFAAARIAFFGIYAEPDTAPDALRRHAAEFSLDFPLRLDRDHALVRFAGVTVTPEAVVADGTGALLYRGRIDDRFVDFGKERPRPTREDVREVLLAVRSGGRPTFRTAAGFGCTISRAVPAR